jgi:hypothetical protein
MTLRGAVAAILAIAVATPVLAAVLIQNFMRADIEAVQACFVKVEGGDATTYSNPLNDPYANVDTTATVTANGVSFLQELVTVKGYDGDRTIYTDVVRYQNDCDHDLSVQLILEDDVAGNPRVENWGAGDLATAIYLSDVPIAQGGAANGGTDLVTNWDGSPIFVDGAGTVVNAQTGSVVIAPGEEIISAFRIDVSDGSQGTTGTLRYTAVATVQ